MPVTVDGFRVARNAFVELYIKMTDLMHEMHYLDMVRKPFGMDVRTMATRLQLIN